MSRAWPVAQVEALSRGAGRVSTVELMHLVNDVGPARTLDGVKSYAAFCGISLRRRGPQRRWHRSAWTDPEDALVRMWAGQMPRETIVSRLNQQFGTSRTLHGVQQRAQRLGVSLVQRNALGLMELVRIFPIHNRQVGQWVDAGLLRSERRGDGRKGSEWRFTVPDVEAFIRSNPHRFDWRAVKAGPWRDFIRALTVRDPWLSVAQTATATGMRPGLLQKWLRAGRIPGARRLGAYQSAPWRIPSSALPTIDRLVAETFGPRLLEVAS